MQVYSPPIIRFIQEIKQFVKRVISEEVKWRVFGDRFHDRSGTYSYPIKVVIYNHKKMLGYFDSDFYELGFHECLMAVSKDKLYAIIRHEIAHYISFIEWGAYILPHGFEFKNFCQKMGWDEEVFRATICLDEGNAALIEESSVLRKIKKLMALSSSSNQNEAEQAMIKSQQLLLKHHLDSNYLESHNEEKIILKRIMKQKKENAKMRAIALILETFFVNTVFSRGGGFIFLEIVGSSLDVEIAEYVADFLNQELDRQWDNVKKTTLLKGTVAKNSFYLGIARGYCNKIASLKRSSHPEARNALMIIEKQLALAKEMVYPRLTISRSYGKNCSRSSALGESVGRNLNIHPGLDASKKSPLLLLNS